MSDLWDIRHYNKGGSAINANYSGYSDAGTTNQVAHATDRQLGFYLNNLDTCSFSIYLDDPMAAQISRLNSFIKVWRNVPGYSDPSNQPCFAGIVTQTTKNGAQNTMQVTAYSPLWRLQTRFHLLNHYLKKNPNTGLTYTQSELIMRLITLTSQAFGSVSYIGIDRGTFYDNGSEVKVAPYFQPKGANVWAEIFDGILSLAGSVDIIPRYHHTSGSSRLMYLDTALKRGGNSGTTFSFHSGSPSNCDDMTELESVNPDKFANYVWAVGQGGANSGKVAASQDTGLMNSLGVYMKRTDYEDVKRIGVAGPPPTFLRARAVNDLARAIVPDTAYTATLSPAGNIYYGRDFDIGDLVHLSASKGAMQINTSQRLYECVLTNSDNNMETAAPTLSKDFTGKVGG
jgi:hypothetical protein